MTLHDWIQRWWPVLPAHARIELSQIVQPHEHVRPGASDQSETSVQSNICLFASQNYRAPLWRNNSGAGEFTDEYGKTRYVRFGLGNQSAPLNKKWKSADLIGMIPMVIQQRHIGHTIGRFLAVETKPEGWVLKPSDKRAQAQSNFLNSVASFGGLAGFAQSVNDFKRIIGDV